MADNSAIEWTDATWNPIRGCTRVSPGCGGPGPHGGCYAEGIAARFSGPGQAYEKLAEMRGHKPRWTGKVAFVEDALTLPLRWRKPRRIFVNSMSDLFHEKVEEGWIDRIFAVMALCPQHTFQVLTKRADRMRAYMAAPATRDRVDAAMNDIAPAHWCAREVEDFGGWPLKGVWLGVSVEDQRRADERIPDLLATPAAVRWISAEPLLGPVDLTNLRCSNDPLADERQDALRGHVYDEDPHDGSAHGITPGYGRLSWVVVGGESGPSARPMQAEWAQSLRDQCARARVAFHFKQHGTWIDVSQLRYLEGWTGGPGFGRFDHCEYDRDAECLRIGKKAAGRLLDGVTHDGFPEVARG